MDLLDRWNRRAPSLTRSKEQSSSTAACHAQHGPTPRSGPDDLSSGWRPRVTTGVIVLADGTVIEGFGVGTTGSAVGEVFLNTAMTGYEEILTDPSYAAQIITFTFPHIGVVGVNDEDIEVVNVTAASAAVGAIIRADFAGPFEFPRSRATRRLAQSPGGRWRHGRRHPRADDAHPRARHAERGHRPCLPTAPSISTRCAPRPRAGRASTAWISCRRSARPSATIGTRRAGRWKAAIAQGRRPAFTSSRSTMELSATSSASSTTAAAP